MLNMFSRDEDKAWFVMFLFMPPLFFVMWFCGKAPKSKDRSNCDLYSTEIGGPILKSSSHHMRRKYPYEDECHCTVLNSDSTQLYLNLGIRSTEPCPNVGDKMLKKKNSYYVTTVDENGDTRSYYDMKRGCE